MNMRPYNYGDLTVETPTFYEGRIEMQYPIIPQTQEQKVFLDSLVEQMRLDNGWTAINEAMTEVGIMLALDITSECERIQFDWDLYVTSGPLDESECTCDDNFWEQIPLSTLGKDETELKLLFLSNIIRLLDIDKSSLEVYRNGFLCS